MSAASMQRWYTLTGGLFVMAVAGTPYAFGVWSPEFKDRLNYTQSEIDNIGSIGNLGLYLGVIGGAIYDFLGPGTTLMTGAVLTFTGYFMLWGTAAGHFPSSAAFVATACFIWSNGSSYFDTASISTSLKAFPNERGRVVGILKSFFGLSAAIVTSIYVSFFKPAVTKFLLFLAILLPTMASITSVIIRLPKKGDSGPMAPSGERRMKLGFGIVFTLAAYLTVKGVLESSGVLHHQAWSAVLMFPILACLLLLSAPHALFSRKGDPRVAADAEDDASVNGKGGDVAMPLLAGDMGGDAGLGEGGDSDSEVEAARARLRLQPPHATFLEAMRSADLWLFFLIIFFLMGSGLMVVNNLGELVQSLGASKDDQDVYVTLFGVGNALGRLSTGFLSDAIEHRVPRTVVMMGTGLGMAASLVMLAFADLNMLYAGAPLVGFNYGSYWALTPTLIANRFGTKAIGSIYAVVGLSPAAGSYVFGSLLTAYIYDKHSPPHSNHCYGKDCFQLTFLVEAAGCIFSILLLVLATVRNTKFRDALVEADKERRAGKDEEAVVVDD